jgi:hypothetical protein
MNVNAQTHTIFFDEKTHPLGAPKVAPPVILPPAGRSAHLQRQWPNGYGETNGGPSAIVGLDRRCEDDGIEWIEWIESTEWIEWIEWRERIES